MARAKRKNILSHRQRLLGCAVQAKISGEHLFRVSTDSSSAVSLTVFGQALFDDITPPLASADSVGDSGKKSTGPAATSGTGADDGENFGGAGSASSRSTIAMVPGARMGSVLLERGEMAPLQLKYAVRKRGVVCSRTTIGGRSDFQRQ